MKATLLLTQACNLACGYCYIDKRSAVMADSVAGRILDFIRSKKPAGEELHLGLFGGEPLLELALVRRIVAMSKAHPACADGAVIQIITNGTLLSDEVVDFVIEEGISVGVSCDGVPDVQDRFRRYAGGGASSSAVEANLRRAAGRIPGLMVNAVLRPETISSLPDGLRYFHGLGLRNVYVNPDFGAPWGESDLPAMEEAYERAAEFYVERRRAGDAFFLNLIDNKVALMVNGGYSPCDRCSMGVGELAFTPEGRIYPCERLVGDGLSDEHCIGDLDAGIDLLKMLRHGGHGKAARAEGRCASCSMRDMCMNSCGCSNYFSTGEYDTPGPFLCASERASMKVALAAFETLSEELGPGFLSRC